jgi:hypothetical protein
MKAPRQVGGYNFQPQFGSERDALIRAMAAEAANQGDAGKLAVGFNLRNRADAGYKGDTIASNLLAQNHRGTAGQYSSFLRNNPGNNTPGRRAMSMDQNSPEYQHYGELADRVLGRMEPDPTGGASHYRNSAHSSAASDKWFNKLTDKVNIGNHTFGREKGFNIAQDTNPNAIGDKTMMAGLTQDAGTPTSSQTLMASLSPAPAQQAPPTTASMLADATVPTPPQRPHFMKGDAPMPPERPNMPDMQLASQPPMDQAPPQSDLGMASVQNPTALGGEGFATSALTTPMLGSNMPASPLPTMFSDAMNPAMGGFDGGMGGVGDFGGPSFDLAGAFG